MDDDSWWLGTRKREIAPLPEGCPPPYFVAAPYDQPLKEAMKALNWPRSSAYGPYVAPDGRPITIATDRKALRCAEQARDQAAPGSANSSAPYGTLFVLWGNNAFHKERQKMLDDAMRNPRWIVRDLPEAKRTLGTRR